MEVKSIEIKTCRNFMEPTIKKRQRVLKNLAEI